MDESLVSAAVQWAERIMQKIDSVLREGGLIMAKRS
jgi:hypothetical protein